MTPWRHPLGSLLPELVSSIFLVSYRIAISSKHFLFRSFLSCSNIIVVPWGRPAGFKSSTPAWERVEIVPWSASREITSGVLGKGKSVIVKMFGSGKVGLSFAQQSLAF